MPWKLAIFVFLLPSVAFAGQDVVFDDRNNGSLDRGPSPRPSVADDFRIDSNGRGGRLDGLPGVWVGDMFYRALSNFTVEKDVGSAACQKQTEMYVWHLKNNSYWAVKMYDSWSRYPNGILTGSTHQMGVYNECIDVHQPVQGKYCMAAVKLSAAVNSSFKIKMKDDVESFDHAWNEILGFIDYQDQYRRNEVKIGICIPESCTAENLEISLQNALDKIFLPHYVQPQVKVEPILCSTDKIVFPYDTGYYVTKTIMYLVLTICLLSTICHLVVITRNENKEKKCSMPDYVYWFSIVHNGRNLIKHNKNNDLNIFNGIKSIVMISILFGHNFLYYVMTPISYTMNIERIFKIGPDLLLTCMNLVDPFFYITGFLTYVMVKPELIKRGANWINVISIIFYKYLRIMPPYAAMMLLTVYFIPYINIGPLWASKMWPEAEKCKNYWWANFLAINNFIDVDKQCLIAGWYISCLLQFIVIGTIIVYICVKKPKFGVIVMCLLLCVSLFIPFILTYTTRSYGIIRVLRPFLENPSNSFEFQNLYGTFYIRGIPFYVGLLTGVIVEELKKREIKLSKLVVYIWTVIITTVCILVQFYGAVFYERHRPYNVIEQAAYATISHCTWTIILFWITVCHFTSGYGPIEKVFNNRLMTVLSRLCYAVYLVNISVLMSVENRQTSAVIPTAELAIDGWIVGIFRTYGTSLFLYLFIEAPFNIIIKTIFFGRKNSSTKEKRPLDTERRDSKIETTQTISHL